MEYKSYDEFLNTEEWRQVAAMVKDRDGNKCVICGSTENLNAHHIGYEGDCLDENDIVTLCNRCHECLHDGIKKCAKLFQVAFMKCFLINCLILFWTFTSGLSPKTKGGLKFAITKTF